MGKLLVIAGASGPFSDFSPYVPAINDEGMVAFQAARRSGGTGAFCGRGGGIAPLAFKASYRSHPDINASGMLAVYAELPDGTQGLVYGAPGVPPEIITHDALPTIGPLGPTLNDSGAIAFRATSAAGRAGIYVAHGSTLTRVVEAGDQFSGFDGLPVICGDGSVVYRADHVQGSQGIHLWRPDGTTRLLATTGPDFAELGRFPAANNAGAVVFAATRPDGSSGVFRTVGDGPIEAVIESGKTFENFRGALIDDEGRIVFFATPTGGELAVYHLYSGAAERVIGLRDEFGTCPLTDFALNAVSLNNRGQIALRIRLADARQFIARIDLLEAGPG